MQHARQKRVEVSSVTPNDVVELHLLLHELHTSNPNNPTLQHARGAVLFTEGELAQGVYILLSGRATVSISSRGGKIVILRVVQSGDVLGLNSALRNCTFDVTVKALETCRTHFIPRSELLALMEKYPRWTQAALLTLSNELTEIANRAKSLFLSQTSSAKLAKLLLEWGNNATPNGSSIVRIDKSFTQEEIAQMIGSSRETVTRLLTTLSRRRIIEITVDSILIHDWSALETVAEDN